MHFPAGGSMKAQTQIIHVMTVNGELRVVSRTEKTRDVIVGSVRRNRFSPKLYGGVSICRNNTSERCAAQ
jgi:hypothetical protein